MTPQALSALKEQREQLWSTIDAVLEENAKLRAELDRLRSAPVAVEVPEKSKNSLSFWKHADGRWFRWDGYANIEMTPSRLLKDGERAVPVKELEVLRERIAWISCQLQVGYSAQIAASELADLLDAPSLDALRSQRAVEGDAK